MELYFKIFWTVKQIRFVFELLQRYKTISLIDNYFKRYFYSEK